MTDRHTNGRPGDGAADDAEQASAGGRGRHRTRGEERAEGIQVPTRSELLEEIGELERGLAAARAEAEEQLQGRQRAAADLANYRRRTDEERAAVTSFANAILITKLLGVLDDFDRALANVPDVVHEGWVEGVRLVERKLRSLLEAEGVTQIEAVGEPFDPNLHEAVVHEPTTDHPDNEVIGEVQRGYRLHDRVLRPALVRVAKNPKSN